MKNKNFRLAAVLVTTIPMTLWAHEGHTDDQVERAVEYRQAIMNVIGWNFKHMAAMVKGEVPFDQAAFSAHAAELQQAASMNLLSGFPEDSDDSDETDAKPDIWMDWEDFQSKFNDLRQQSDQLAAVAAKGDPEASRKQFGATGKTCKACHKAYKN